MDKNYAEAIVEVSVMTRDSAFQTLVTLAQNDPVTFVNLMRGTYEVPTTLAITRRVVEVNMTQDHIREVSRLKSIDAIRYLRTQTGCGLKDGKDAVEYVKDHPWEFLSEGFGSG
jgi:ribosomal protein L7/L12